MGGAACAAAPPAWAEATSCERASRAPALMKFCFARSWLRFRFAAASARQNNWRAARAFKPAVAGSETGPVIPGDEVGSSAYQANTQELRAAWRASHHLLQLSLARQQLGLPSVQRMAALQTLQVGGGRYATPYALVRALKAGGVQAPAALVGLFKGEAIGKRLVQVAPE